MKNSSYVFEAILRAERVPQNILVFCVPAVQWMVVKLQSHEMIHHVAIFNRSEKENHQDHDMLNCVSTVIYIHYRVDMSSIMMTDEKNCVH